MSNPPEKPKFFVYITGFQKLLAAISGSMFAMALVTMIPLVETMFKSNILFLSNLRMGMAATSLIAGGFVGVPQIINMVKWISEFYDFYRKFKEGKSD
jgi:hypothetical protein